MALPLISANQRYLIERGGTATDRIPALARDVNPIITEVNNLIDGSISTNTLALAGTTDSTSTTTGTLTVAGGVGIAKALFVSTTTPASISNTGVLSVTNATDSTTSTTGSVIITGGVGIAKALFVGTTVNAGTALTVGTDQTFAKEVNHTISVATSTTANTAGANLTVSSAIGVGTGSGGTMTISGGASGAGATGDGGRVAVTGGTAGSTNGAGGAVIVTAGAKAGSGIGGQVHLRSAADTPVLVKKAVASTGADTVTLTVAQLFNGIMVQTPTTTTTTTTPTGAQISAALGSSLAVGDSFEFSLINIGGTGDDITFTAGASGVTITGGALVFPVTDAEGDHSAGTATFRFVNTAADTWIAYRVA